MLATTSPASSVGVVTTTSSALTYAGLYTDISPGIDALSSNFQGSISSATTTVMFSGAPTTSPSTARAMESLFFYASAAQTVQVVVTISSVNYPLTPVVSLAAGESMHISSSGALSVYSANGVLKVVNTVSGPSSSVLISPGFSTAALTSVKTITSLSSFALYMDKAPRALTTVAARYRVTTAMVTPTWAEIAIGVGSINVGNNPTIKIVGFADVSAVLTSIGQKTTNIAVSSSQSIKEGDDLWFIIGCQAVTAPIVRATSIADDIQVGIQGSAAVRPSTVIGSSTVFTIEGATVLPAWVALII